MTRKIYDAWLKVSNGEEKMIEEGTTLINTLMTSGLRYGWDFNFREFKFFGCAARIQIECDKDTIEKIKRFTNYRWEETKPLP